MSKITLSQIVTFVEHLTAEIQKVVPEFQGFGANKNANIGAGLVDSETIANAILAALAASGNFEAVALSPVVSAGEVLVNIVAGLFGIPTTAASPVQQILATGPKLAPTGGDDSLGDVNADTGAIVQQPAVKTS